MIRTRKNVDHKQLEKDEVPNSLLIPLSMVKSIEFLLLKQKAGVRFSVGSNQKLVG